MKQIIWLIIGMLCLDIALGADCAELPQTGLITENTKLCSDTYDAPDGIKIEANDIMLDCGTAVIRGNYLKGTGITVANHRNITITRCNVATYNVGVYIANSSQIHLYDNALLKNDIGVRMYNAYENLIEKHNDKSNLKPVSALVSKYNTIILGNKNIDKAFCETNACNTHRDMNPCENNDFYCSPRCTPETDSDCKKQEIIPAIEEAPEGTGAVQTELPANEIQNNSTINETALQEEREKQSKYLMYPIFYLIGLLVFQFIKYVKEFDKEDKD